MRNIKFRGQHSQAVVNPGQWIYFDYTGDDNLVVVDRDTIGQYTGLKDKNGKDIYEGDIVHYNDTGNVYKDEYKGIVIFSWRTLQFCVESYSKILKGIRLIPLVSNEHPHFASSKTEIIGNKYDNPELLDANSQLDEQKKLKYKCMICKETKTEDEPCKCMREYTESQQSEMDRVSKGERCKCCNLYECEKMNANSIKEVDKYE